VLGTWRRAFGPKRMGPCDIHLGGWILDLRMLGLRGILHGGWLWTQTHMLSRSIGASNYLDIRDLGTRGHVPHSERSTLHVDTWRMNHHGRGSIGIIT
jgi:hypothetical protein